MSKFKVGDKVVCIKPVSQNITAITGIVEGSCYTVAAVGPGWISLQEAHKREFTFSARHFEMCWDLARAKQLRYEAEVAVCRYNKYLQQQPQMQPIVIQ
ncbi:MAG: hypothetical protein [Bacteriophage sp.]|nr:MAG: hypothetical protein [Bacteriophage sp.]